MKRWLLLLLCITALNVQGQLSLIPQPKKVSLGKGAFDLQKCRTITLTDTAFRKEGLRLQQLLRENGYTLQMNDKRTKSSIVIGRQADGRSDEAYRLDVTPEQVLLNARDIKGIFYGIQTLLQLIDAKGKIPSCHIDDHPAFSWRGYMVDAGRNYQSIATLKQQIDIMARYKYNIFHFHITEDIAWRLAVKQYPQLTRPEYMIRQKGKCYSEAELKELITYCRDRYITLIPEIDMPGHSAAFKRAMGTDMQSDTGVTIMQNIIREFCATYDVPYLHIGGDEVHIRNRQFLPEMTALVHQLGKQTIGWSPGGNVGPLTIRQLWGYEGVKDTTLTYIDSRHLYLNHMDPLESVVTIFFRKLGDSMEEDRNVKGGILCLWHDRKVADEQDLFRMNPVYPGLLAFAEKAWCGGGLDGWTANIGAPGTEKAKAFAAFEQRLLAHQQRYFSRLPFPYVKQSGIRWQLFGPYNNNGDLARTFEPEKSKDQLKPAMEAIGGTVILRHWWAPGVGGLLKDPHPNTTWYATTKIWSDREKTAGYWIGFNNFSRSPNTDSPPKGAWDDKQSAIWLNGIPVAPPVWKRGGEKGDAEIPLVDEGYEYRAPTLLHLKKGWNTVLVKVPVGRLEGPNWHNPVKWMFTMVPAGL